MTTSDKVVAIIYIIKCTHPESSGNGYVGQTRSHVLNRGVLRPHGAERRFREHISEALVNNSTKQCWKLNNAIRKYGEETFTVEVLESSILLDEADFFETLYIELMDTMKNGYNITTGGRGGPHSPEISLRVATTLSKNYDKRRREKYKDADVSLVQLNRLETKGVRVYVHESDGRNTYTSFYGRHSTLENSAMRAYELALLLVNGDLAKIRIAGLLQELIVFEKEGETVKLREVP